MGGGWGGLEKKGKKVFNDHYPTPNYLIWILQKGVGGGSSFRNLLIKDFLEKKVILCEDRM